jgi:phosphatidylglycerophosphate synthase
MTVIGIAAVVVSGFDVGLSPVPAAVVVLIAVAWSTFGLGHLYRSVVGHTTADRVTMLRLAFASAAVLLLVLAEATGTVDASSPRFRAVFSALLAVAVISDFADGKVARRLETTRFGAQWDMQNDAAFAMLLSIVAVIYVGVDAWVILIGLARYLFVLLVPDSHENVTTPRLYDLFGKAVCAVTVVSLSVVVAGGSGGIAAYVALIVSLAAVASSFGWFIYLLRRERAAVAYLRAHSRPRQQVHVD